MVSRNLIEYVSLLMSFLAIVLSYGCLMGKHLVLFFSFYVDDGILIVGNFFILLEDGLLTFLQWVAVF